jgi:putative addiction module killer protein
MGNIYVTIVGDRDSGVCRRQRTNSLSKLAGHARRNDAGEDRHFRASDAAGNFSGAKTVGAGVSELRLDFGPGYRVYFGNDGERLVILLVGGSKKRQQADIAAAHVFWADYKNRKNKKED